MENLVCDKSGLYLPKNFVDEKESLKKVINEYVDKAVFANQHIKHPYFLTFHAKFNEMNPGEFCIDPPKITDRLPPFLSNTMVFWVNNQSGICEILWMVAPKVKGEKLKVNFNKTGVAYLQAKSAMPS